MLTAVTNSFVNLLFPRRCFVCGSDSTEEDICLTCLEFCCKNSNQTMNNGNSCGFLYYFEFSIKQLIKSGKYHGDLLSVFLLLKIAEKELVKSPLLAELALFSPQAITYVPTHFFDRIRRSVDLPSMFAHLIAKKLKVPAAPLLSRKGFNNPQALRKHRSDRLTQIRGAFLVRNNHLRFERLLLVDDVVTTGATLHEASKMLKQLCPDVRCVAIAKTPL